MKTGLARSADWRILFSGNEQALLGALGGRVSATPVIITVAAAVTDQPVQRVETMAFTHESSDASRSAGVDPLFEAVELVRRSRGPHLPDRLEQRILGYYTTCLRAILRVEARRQAYRRQQDDGLKWFFVRAGYGKPIWYVEGVHSNRPVVDLRTTLGAQPNQVMASAD